MVLCIFALPIFALLGIFSIKYRKLALESLECVFRTATFRKCRSGLDDRIKSKITGSIMRYNPKIAGLVYKNYKIVAWIIIILLVWSGCQSGVSVYNYINYGNCNGPESIGFCILDPAGTGISMAETDLPHNPVSPTFSLDDIIMGNPDAEITIIEFGCYSCPYTQQAQRVIEEVLDYYDGKVNVVFKHFPIPHHRGSYEASLLVLCANDIKVHKAMLNGKTEDIDIEQYRRCIVNETYKNKIAADTLMGVQAGVLGTPSFFINGEKIVGPKPFKTFAAIIDEQ